MRHVYGPIWALAAAASIAACTNDTLGAPSGSNATTQPGMTGGVAGVETAGAGSRAPSGGAAASAAGMAAVVAVGGSAGVPAAGSGGATRTPSSAGSGGTGPAGAGAGPTPPGGAGVGGGDSRSSATAQPSLPAITGSCPTFTTGDLSFGGVTGVMAVGPKMSGSGALLFYFAGTGSPASSYADMGIGSKNVERLTSQGGMVISIQGMSGQDTQCSMSGYYSSDFTALGQLAACAVREHAIDARRIYATGCSAGGGTSACMATRLAGYIAAVATNSGGLTMSEPVQGTTAPAVMTMWGGTADFGGIFGTFSKNLGDQVKKAQGFVVDCNHEAGHCGAPPELYDAAIDFLLAHPYGERPEPYAGSLPASFPAYCKIY